LRRKRKEVGKPRFCFADWWNQKEHSKGETRGRKACFKKPSERRYFDLRHRLLPKKGAREGKEHEKKARGKSLQRD